VRTTWILVAFALAGLTNVGRAAVPAPDPAFGTAGTATLTFSALGGSVAALAIQLDGKPVIGYGNVVLIGGFGAPFGTQGFLGRLDLDGSVDTSLFGGPIAEYEVPRVLADRNGHVLIALSSILARYRGDGTLDGPYTFNAASATNAFASRPLTFVDLALQADDKVVAVGTVGIENALGQGSQGVEVVRFNTDGSLDTSFGAAGHVRIPLPAGFDDAVGVVALPQRKIGIAINRSTQSTTPAVVRLNGDGTFDSTFGVGGVVSGLAGDIGEAIAVQSDGKILLASIGPGSPSTVVRVMRLTDTGATDSSFGNFGFAVHSLSGGMPHPVRLAVQANDKFLLSINAPAQVSRYGSNGSVDASFGEGGSLSPVSLRAINAIALGPDASLWLAGESTQSAAQANVTGRGNPAVVHLIGGSTAVVEYYNAGLDHYFISTNPQETRALDLGQFGGWARTGLSFNALGPTVFMAEDSVPVCRFYIPPPFGDSHFFSASQAECNAVSSRFPQFILETAQAMRVGLPDPGTGACSTAMPVPVYRIWDARHDTNHRYTANRGTRDAMVAKGWIAEGYGPDAVAMCGASQ
jgi:uncharacterized delta-60 repeat protein